MVWDLYLVARSALRLIVLLTATVGGFMAVAVLTGAPLMLALVAWSIHSAIGHLPAEATVLVRNAQPAVARVAPRIKRDRA